MATEPSRNSLPFEPRNKRTKKTPKSKPEGVANPTPPTATKKEKDKPKSATKDTKAAMAIPDQVGKRMIRRMVVLCGIPTLLGISSFFVSYFLVHSLNIQLPHVAVLLVSMGFWGLGVLGLSYGVLSASWDEDAPGTLVGWQEFRINLDRMTSAWRSAKQKD